MTIESEADVVALQRIGGIVSSVFHDMLAAASRLVTESGDGWTLVGARGNLSAQYEHTMIITRGEPIVVTRH